MRHELLLTRKGLLALALASVPLLGAGVLVAGLRGAATVATAIVIVAANQSLAAASTGWSRKLSPGVVAIGYAGFVFRMFAVFAAFAAASAAPWIQRNLFAIAFCVALAVTLTVECLSYVRKTYVPAWRVSS